MLGQLPHGHWPSRLAAFQILRLNLVTDGLPALALGVEPPERDLMQRPSRPPREPVIPPREGPLILLHGALVAACVNRSSREAAANVPADAQPQAASAEVARLW